MIKKRQLASQNQKLAKPQAKKPAETAAFVEHFQELRQRLFYVALSVVVFSAAAYALERQVVSALLRPAHGQHFIYTSPIGGMNFLVKLCIYVGVAISIPVIVYQFLRYLEPLVPRSSTRFIFVGTLASGLFALAGMVFGYFIGLPAALEFLLHQFVTQQVSPLLTIESYLSFVSMYMIGAALMFQIPLIVLFINRIKPLKPSQLFHYERWVILVSVVLAFIMNPTPNIISQLFIAGPMILTYQISIAIIWWQNRKAKQPAIEAGSTEQNHQPILTPKPSIELRRPAYSLSNVGSAEPRAVELPLRPRTYIDGIIAAPNLTQPKA